jgi:transposase
LGEGRFRCGSCGYTFAHLTGTWIALSRISPVKWLWLIKLFELEITAWQAAAQLGVSYPTVLRAYTIIRRSVLAEEQPELLRQEVEADESYFGGRRKGMRGRGAAGKIPVFGILERKGKVQVTVVPDVRARTLMDETVKLVKRGSLVYTDKYHSYDALTFYGYQHLRVDHDRRFSRGKVHINGLEGFWSYAKGKLLKHHGVSPHRFPLYLYEMQFRYNHRRENLFDLFLQAVLKPVPDLL